MPSTSFLILRCIDYSFTKISALESIIKHYMPYLQKRRISPPSNRQETIKRHNEKWDHYYGNVRWRKLRDYYKSLHPICKSCAINGRSVPAEHLHHRVPFSWFTEEQDRWAALLDIDNLEPLCRECHNKIHLTLKRPDDFEQSSYYKKIHNM